MTTIIKPQQERSRKSLERLLDASATHIARGNFENVSIAEIAKSADVSVGTFYGRFKNKAALFDVVQEQVFNDALKDIDARITEFIHQANKQSPTRLKTLVDFIVDLTDRLYRNNSGIFRAIFLHTRTQRDPELLERVAAFNRACLTAGDRVFAVAQAAHIHETSLEHWRKGLEIIAVYLRESILFGQPIATGAPHEPEVMKQAAATMFLSFLKQG